MSDEEIKKALKSVLAEQKLNAEVKNLRLTFELKRLYDFLKKNQTSAAQSDSDFDDFIKRAKDIVQELDSVSLKAHKLWLFELSTALKKSKIDVENLLIESNDVEKKLGREMYVRQKSLQSDRSYVRFIVEIVLTYLEAPEATAPKQTKYNRITDEIRKLMKTVNLPDLAVEEIEKLDTLVAQYFSEKKRPKVRPTVDDIIDRLKKVQQHLKSVFSKK